VKQDRTAVVTGGAGFIGSHLAGELARRGYHVVILDDLSTGKKGNIAALLSPTLHHPSSITHHTSRLSGVDFIEGSVTDLSLLQDVFRGADVVFHQAAVASVPRSIENPELTHRANLTGTLNVLLAGRDKGVKKVVYASSSSVYGDTPTLPKSEDMSPNPLSPYAVTKLAGEYYCQVFRQVYGLATVCLRYFNVYGPRQDPDSQYAAVVPRFIARVAAGQAPIIFGDGEQTRDFIFVADAVEANILAAESNATGVFNVGRGESTTINDLAEMLIGLMGKSVRRVHEGPRPGDPRHNLADISRATGLGYSPEYSLQRGLQETIGAMRDA
jgi:UDP-glucose 4-epimerase